MDFRNRIPPPIVTLVFALLIYFSADLLPSLRFELQNALALLFAIAGLGVIAAAIIPFVKLKTTVNPLAPKSATSLVTDGVFRFSRNPMYLGMLLLIISVSICTGAVASVVLLPSFVVYIRVFQILPEEQAMRELFPDAYQAYCKQVRRWI